jgi:pilus assembly protein CpaB
MRRRLVVILAVAVVAGLMASVLVYRAIAEMQAAAGRGQSMDNIVVAAVDVDLGETLTPQHVKLVAWPKAAVPAGAVRALPDAVGRVVRASLLASEPLFEGKLAPQGHGGIMPMLVPQGRRGITIKVDDAVKESGFVLPNGRVDVLVSMPKGTDGHERMAKLILQDVLVLAAGQTVEMRDNKPVSVTTVTLALTPDQAERLALAQSEGRLVLGTRNLHDKEFVRTPGVTRETLLGTEPSPTPKSTTPSTGPLASAPLPPPRLEAHTISVLKAGRLSEHVFVRADGARPWVEKDSREQKSPQ